MTEQKQTKAPTAQGAVELTEDALNAAAGGAKSAVDHKEWLQVVAKDGTKSVAVATGGNGI